ncbi:MAG: Thivi_2564 family membrane protein [Emticicia sp.]|uniref:Thivi_2564 family membrane protein n=1 Tax=Emticicia sp. TaxID=1930953 RepID=UPI003BA43D3A
MPLVNILVVLIVAGIVLWLINSYIPMDGKIKRILNIVFVVVIIIWLLKTFGLLTGLMNINV